MNSKDLIDTGIFNTRINYKERKRMSEYVLEAVNVSKSFPGVRALQGVKLQISRGEIHGLVGENGAGKSTLLKIINGDIPNGAYEGEIKVNNESVSFKSPHDAHLKGIGYVPQEINVLNELSVAENIFVGYLPQASNRKYLVNMNTLYKKAEEHLKSLHLTLNPEVKVRMLSTAQKQILMIARALSHDAPILILDEPTTALTHEEVNSLFFILNKMRDSGRSIIFVTHKLEEITSITDKVTIFRDGRYISTYEKNNYKSSQIIADMVGRKIESLYPKRNVELGEEILRIEGLTIEHPRIMNRYLLDNVSFSLKKGEVLGLVGLVGSGRTETLRGIFGAMKRKKGKIFLYGKEVQIQNPAEALKNGLGFVTEDRKKDGLLMLNNIKRNISINNLKSLKKAGVLNNYRETVASRKYFDRMRIKAPSVESKVVSLSGGNQQKVLIARALNSDPQIMLLDEPTKGIDVGSKNEIYNIINELSASGISIIMVSSELPEMLGMCDRFIVLSDGKAVAELGRADASQEAIMTACFSG